MVDTMAPSSFGESLMDVTPDVSSKNFMLEPALPIIIPQLETGTNNRVTKSNTGMLPV